LCLSSSLAVYFYNYSFCVPLNRDDRHLLAHAMASFHFSHKAVFLKEKLNLEPILRSRVVSPWL
jgi:hypothetical protein